MFHDQNEPNMVIGCLDISMNQSTVKSSYAYLGNDMLGYAVAVPLCL